MYFKAQNYNILLKVVLSNELGHPGEGFCLDLFAIIYFT